MYNQKNKKRWISLLLSLVMIISVLGAYTPKVEAAGKVKLAKSSGSVVIGGTQNIKIKNAPKGATITYKSNKVSVAKVSKKGKVRGIKAGTAKITITVKKGKSKTKLSYKLTVKKPKLSKSSVSIGTKKSTTLSIKNLPTKSAKVKYTWSSDNKKIATVKNGKVTGVSAGTTNIKVKIKSDKNFSYTLKCKVKVKEVNTTYTVSFDTSGGNYIASQTVNKNQQVNRPTDPLRNGYEFIGWYMDYSLSIPYNFYSEVTGNMTLYAKWSKLPADMEIVVFDTNGGSYISYQMVQEGNRVRQPSNPTKEGYRFVGWYMDYALSMPYDFSTIVTESFVLYAKWEVTPIVTYTVWFDSNGGSSVGTQIVEEWRTVARPIDPVREGYTFAGWYTDFGLNNAYDFSRSVTSNLTLYAKWEEVPITTYIVSFDSNGGSNVEAQVVEEFQTVIRPIDPVKEGHIFVGWYTDFELNNAYDFSRSVTSNLILYAKWEKVPITTYIVSFDSNGGSSVETQVVEEFQTARKPSDPIREGYTFIGWYIDKELTTIYDFSVLVTENIILYAYWDENKNEEWQTLNEDYISSENSIIYSENEGIYFVEGIILTILKDDITEKQMEILLSSMNGEVVGRIDELDMYQIKISTSSLSEINEIANRIMQDFNFVLYATYDSVTFDAQDSIMAFVPNDPWDGDVSDEDWSDDNVNGSNWWIEAVNAQQAWAYNDNFSEINVGICDSSFDIGHEDLKNRYSFPNELLESRNETVWTSPDVKNETSYHGTHVAGIIGAEANNEKGITGIAWNSHMLFAPTTFTDANVYANLTYLVRAGAKVINFSLGKSENLKDSNPAYNDAVIVREGNLAATFMAKLRDEGFDFIVVQSAGNGTESNTAIDAKHNGGFCSVTERSITCSERTNIDDILERIIIVGAAEQNENDYQCTSFSNFGNQVNICAPGERIYSTVPGDTFWGFEFSGGYNIMSGTSMAAPIVTGICALVWSVNTDFTGSEVKNIVCEKTSKTVNPNPETASSKTYPMVDAKLAVEEALRKSNKVFGTITGKVCKASDHSISVNGAQVEISKEDIVIRTVVTDNDGKYSINLEPGTYQMKVIASGYLNFNAYITVSQNENTYMETFLMVEGKETDRGVVSGIIYNALTGTGIENVTLSLRKGWNNNFGDIETTIITDQDGKYFIDLPIGNYTINAVKDGYISNSINIVVQSETNDNQNGSMSPIILGNNFRIVLTWGKNPVDLDSHLVGTLSSGKDFHVYFRQKSQYDNEIQVCNLDLDDITSYGPETITLNTTTDLPYYYYIHRYKGSGTIEESEAKINVYQGNTLVATFNVPTDQGNNDYWNVFAIVNGKLIVKNTITENVDKTYGLN